MFSTWIGDIKVHIFVAGVALMLAVGFFTNIQLLLAFLGIHYAMELVIKYDSRIATVIRNIREKQRKRKEQEIAKSVQEHRRQQDKWAEQTGKKPN